MRAALIGNREDMDAGLVGHALRRHGWSFTELIREEPHTWPRHEEFGLVLSLGSSWSTYWDEFHNETEEERTFLRNSHYAGTPILGICFGAQQLSAALGGTVERSATPEIGWHDVSRIPESTGVPGAEILAGQWFQWHYDRFSVPSGAVALAESAVSPQAFTAGRSLGLQFHPEVTESVVALWCAGGGTDELAAAGVDAGALLAETRDMQNDVRRRTDALVAWFLREVAQAHETHP